MINSRRTVTEEDSGSCCANCKHLKAERMPEKSGNIYYQCGIDGALYFDPGLLSMFTCHKYKEVKLNGRI